MRPSFMYTMFVKKRKNEASIDVVRKREKFTFTLLILQLYTFSQMTQHEEYFSCREREMISNETNLN
jgi:hypothetical protein